jgi:hypothetical protein
MPSYPRGKVDIAKKDDVSSNPDVQQRNASLGFSSELNSSKILIAIVYQAGKHRWA